jgi:hypothetical protein
MTTGKDKKKQNEPPEAPVDLAARIGRGTPDDLGTGAGDAVSPKADSSRPNVIGGGESPTPVFAPSAEGEDEKTEPIISVRGAPSFGEVDLVVTPLPTPDDWHRFELALRKVRGVTQLRPEYYRHGVAKMRVSWEGTERLATALRSGVPGYRVRVIGEDRATLQILVSSETEERRPG